MSSRKENFSNFGQSAVNGLQAGENITIGDINQIINNSSSDSYNHIATIFSEYNKKVQKLDRLFRERSLYNQKNINKELQNYCKDIRRRIEELQEEMKEEEEKLQETIQEKEEELQEKRQELQEKMEKEEEEEEEDEDIQEDNDQDTLQSEEKSSKGGFGCEELVMITLVGAAIWIGKEQSGGWNKEPERDIEDIEQEIENIKQDIKDIKQDIKQNIEDIKRDICELKDLIQLVNNFMRGGAIELDVDSILDEDSLSNLSSDAKIFVESVKDDYRTQQEQLKASHTEEYDECVIEKNTKIYKHSLRSFLDKDGYPLSSNSINGIRSLLDQLTLTEWNVQEIEEEVIRPFCLENLEIYEQTYLDKLSEEKFPLGADTVSELRDLEDKLGLNTFNFLQSEVIAIKKDISKPFCKDNFQEYQQIYKQKLQQKGLNLNSDDLFQLDKTKSRLGLGSFQFKDLDIEKVEQELIELVYRENIQEYEQEYERKLTQEGFPLNPNTISELNCLEKTLGLGNFQFSNCPNPLSIKEKLVKPYYQANLQTYGREYKQKLYQFGVNFSQKNIAELEKLRSRFGFDIYYLEKLGLQALFNTEEIDRIELELMELVYRENLQRYQQEYKRKLEKEGFNLSYFTISELIHLDDTLGLSSYQIRDCSELKSIKTKLIKPLYKLNLQKYSQEYKRKLYQFGLSFAENYTLELGKLRCGFGLTSSHLKNLDILGQSFPLKTDLFTVEKIAKELFYTESLQYYAQEFKREIESKLYFADQDSKLKEPLQTLGIRSEDIKIVEGLIRNNWEIEHLFYQRDSDTSYWKLINSLAQYKWRKADALTRDILLKLANRSGKSVREHPPLADRLFSTNHLQEFLAPTNHASSKSEYSHSVLDKEAIEKISARDVYTLDRLWVEYSKGRFGFSVQKRIFDEVKQERKKFAEKIGWSDVGLIGDMFSSIPYNTFSWIPYDKLKFTLNAPEGHLPVWAAKDMKIFPDDFHHLKVWDFK